MKNYFFSIFLLFVSCSNELKKPAPILKQGRCDTVFYVLKNKETERFIDSALGKKFVEDCNLKFSNMYDTLFISFSISDTSIITNNTPASNRFLLLKEKRVKVLAGEDYFLSEKRLNRTINRDPNVIRFDLSIPDLNVFNTWKYPPQ